MTVDRPAISEPKALRSLFAALVESCEDAIITKTLEGTITSWNESAHRMLGHTAEEAIGRSITILIPPDRLGEELHILEQLRKGQRIEHYETVRLAKDGRLLDVSLTISPVYDGLGTVIGASKIMRDISERRATDRAVAEEHRLLELLHQASASLASSMDLASVLQALTDAATDMCGAEFGAFLSHASNGNGDVFELAARSVARNETFESLARAGVLAKWAATFAGDRVIRIDDVLADARHQPWWHLPLRSYLAVPVLSLDRGEVIGRLLFVHSEVGVFNDRISRFVSSLASNASIAIGKARLFEERESLLESERAARTQAERANVSKDEFLATLSHELRTPLNNILGWTHVLRRSKSERDVARGMEIIERNVRLQTQLVDDLLDMSRIVSGQMRLEMQTIMPTSFVQAALDSLRPIADVRGVKISARLDPDAGPLSGDSGRLQQVVWNLVSNAIKFTPPGGAIEVALEQVDSRIEIRVDDTGVGIAPDLLPHVFERFRQGDSSTTRRHGGLGIGLAIVERLVHLHGGQVIVASEGENRGATFRVQLPRASVEGFEVQAYRPPAIAPGDASLLASADLSGLKVLAIDDERDARNLVERILSDCGAIVSTAASGAEAIGEIARQRPDVVICDIGMPEMDGYELLRRIRTLGAEHGAPVRAIALTAFARSEDRTRAMMAGYLAHVPKPVEPFELIATVASVAGRTR